jgi:DNA-binding CsgD family transcriptional regulator
MRVYVVAQYPTIRAGLTALVQSQPGWKVVGDELPTTKLPERVDVALVDLDGLENPEMLAKWLGILTPRAGLVAIDVTAMDGRRGAVRQAPGAHSLLGLVARTAEDYGLAFGALPRDATRDEIIAALTAVSSGLVVLDRRLARDYLSFRQSAAVAAPLQVPGDAGGEMLETLTGRELEVLQLLAEGLPNKLIAARLHITEHTAKFHVSSIMLKLGASSRTEAVTLAARRGLLLL